MNEQLRLSSIRNVLARLEETIIFGLIERAQFCRNAEIYTAGVCEGRLDGLCLVDYLLRETERIHARVRRYTSPDEHPFSPGLPEPILPPLSFGENPLRPNTININDRIRRAWERDVVPHICRDGDDRQYGSSSVLDVTCLQAISKRVHYGKFVAEAKYRESPGTFLDAVRAGDRDRLMAGLTDGKVEADVLKRVQAKAEAFSLALANRPDEGGFSPAAVVDIYARWIIPLNKDVQVAYFLEAVAVHPDVPGGKVD